METEPVQETYSLKTNPEVIITIGETSVRQLVILRNSLTEQAAALWEDLGYIDKAIENAETTTTV